MKRIVFVLALLLLCVPQFITAQTIQVTGTVTSASEKYPLEGAGVMVKGTKTGVATDYNGKFVINVGKNAVLVITSVGYKTVEIPINGRSVVNVAMNEDAALLEETIVVGYGTAKKISSVVGAATTVKSKTLTDKPVVNVADALQGQVAGLQVYTSSGDPSASVSMRLRGVNSIYASTDPLFILDGSPVLGSIFSTLNANDIESVTILKDASSTAIYGSRAANGVVYITTKKGTGERPVVKISANYGITNLATNRAKMMNSREWFTFAEMIDPTLKTNASWQSTKNFRLSNNIGCNWKKWILNENAPSMGGDFTISGRTNKTDYYVSANVARQTSIEQNSNLTRYGVRFNINTKVNNWFKFGINTGLSYDGHHTTYQSGSSYSNYWGNPINWAYWSLPWQVPWDILTDDNGNFIGYGDEQNYLSDWGGYSWKYRAKYRTNKYNYVRLNSNLYEELTPIKGLTIRFAQAVEGYDYRNSQKNSKDPEGYNSTTYAYEYFSRYYRLTSTNTAEYKFSIGENHNITALVGQEAIRSNNEAFSAKSDGQTDLRLSDVNMGVTPKMPSYAWDKVTYISIFSRLSYDFAGKYYLDASFRKDGCSKFGASDKYANFWSVGGMWDAKKESFIKDVNWLDKLQVKASYGTIGNSGIDNYLSLGVSGKGSIYNGNTSWGLSSPGNPDLTWETLKTFNVGVNFRVFNFAEANIEFYNKVTSDMLMSVPYSYSTGFSSGWGNVGKMQNRGVEGTFTFNIINTRNTNLTVSVNASYNKDKITALFGGRNNFALEDYGLNLTVGHSYGEFYQVRWAGVDPANGKPLWYDKEGNVTSTYKSSDAVLIGKSQFAPWAGGVQIDFSWKNFSMQANITGVFKKYMINNARLFYTNTAVTGTGSNYIKEMITGTWTYPGQIAKYPSTEYEQGVFDTRLIEDASFVRLKNVTLSYTFNNVASKLGFINGIRVYLTGRNLLTFTKYSGDDPEVDSNLANGNYPNTKQVTAGIELTF